MTSCRRSPQVHLIRRVLAAVLGDDAATEVIIRGTDGAWDRTAALGVAAAALSCGGHAPSWAAAGRGLELGKMPWLGSVWEAMAAEDGGDGGCGPGQTLFVDDDRGNTSSAEACGARPPSSAPAPSPNQSLPPSCGTSELPPLSHGRWRSSRPRSRIKTCDARAHP